jgi:hypothetical protein
MLGTQYEGGAVSDGGTVIPTSLKIGLLIKMLVEQIQYHQPHLYHKISKLSKKYCLNLRTTFKENFT